MNATKLFTATAFAALASIGAHAGPADFNLQNRSPFQSTRPAAEVKAEVKAEAIAAARNPNNGEVDRVAAQAPKATSELARATVRAQTIAALRAGQIPHGEASM
ncbi:DUF4148 domain-containing protein [Rhodoferax sediminis]|uniref:DUF4148 domain-containing protein n=1 Tax=Rhodoferax sediminis TaxID=2509614 RepID=A0A515DEY3_9BURK|nr:DUF4148 domain-containing protein [Rhodoferax sediminis]QDL38949.1 DUF4148 domain-containing protein [Rhodoferax sediminis]